MSKRQREPDTASVPDDQPHTVNIVAIDNYGAWATVPGFDKKHVLVSSEGWVRTRTKGGKRGSLAAPKRGTLNDHGYYSVGVNFKNRQVHALVCLAFHGLPPTAQHTTDHIEKYDGDWSRQRRDNRACNLRWATKSDQNKHRNPRKRVRTGKPVEARRMEDVMTPWRWFASTNAASKALGVNSGCINPICNRIRGKKKTRGYTFRWAAPLEPQNDLAAVVDTDPSKCREVERWVHVNDRLWVSNRGRLQNKNPRGEGWGPRITPKVTKGNAYVMINHNKRDRYFHVVVWEAFNGPVPEGYVVDHIKEGDKSDNALENLQAMTQRENTQKAHDYRRAQSRSSWP